MKVWVVVFSLFSIVSFASPEDLDEDEVFNAQDLCAYTPLKARSWKTGPYTGCSEGQLLDSYFAARQRGDTYKQSQTCEARLVSNLQSLIGRLQSRDYSAESCRWKISGILDGIQPYVDFGNEDTRKYGAIYPQTLPMPRLQDRLKICLNTTRFIASEMDALDRMSCRFSIDQWREQTARIPSSSGASGGSISAPGSYTVMGEDGNYIVGSNGVTYTRSGSFTHGSDGTVYTHMGSITIGSDGVTYVTSGDITTGSNGRTCIRHGSFINCF